MFLFINVSQTGILDIKLFDGNKIIKSIKKEGNFKLTEKLLFFINELLKIEKITLNDLNGIVTVIGPGAFTSLRIMSIVINTISQLNEIPVYGDVFDNLNDDVKICNSVNKVKLNFAITPYYNKEPNITI